MTKSRLWLHVAQTVEDIQDLCRAAHAAELRAIERARAQPLMADDDSLMPTPFPPPTAGAPAGPESGGADIVALRASLRMKLVDLKSSLAETRTEQEVYYALFPLVVFTDELAQAATAGRTGAWPPLQTELYDIYNGGERFYSTLETLLKREETSTLVFEVFYLCLSAGFAGQYQGSAAKIEEYKARIAFRIPADRPTPDAENAGAAPEPVQLVAFPAWYYATAALFIVGVFGLLHLLGRLEALPTG